MTNAKRCIDCAYCTARYDPYAQRSVMQCVRRGVDVHSTDRGCTDFVEEDFVIYECERCGCRNSVDFEPGATVTIQHGNRRKFVKLCGACARELDRTLGGGSDGEGAS